MRKIRLGLLVCASALCAGPSHAQPVPHGPNCVTWHVDPVNGADVFPGAGTLAQPFQTLTFAVGVAAASQEIDTIVLLPGTYDTLETYPITMPPDVSIQGTSALNTILIARSPEQSVLRFAPSTPAAYDQVVVDGVAFVGQVRCIEVWDGQFERFRVRSNPTIANCFLIDSGNTAVDIVVSDEAPPFPGHDANNDGFVENRPKFINCTIVTSTIGILNRSLSAAGKASFGASEPGLLNCLLSSNGITDLEGIDAGDVITCAFDDANMAGISPPIGAQPVPVFMPGSVFSTTSGYPPLYVELNLGPAVTPFDLRLRPGPPPPVLPAISPAIDTGSIPTPLAWPNGTTGQRLFACTVDIFDADCEGYGNPRVARNMIDIGADESGELIVGGFFPLGTTNFPASSQMEIWLNPFPPLPAGPYNGACALNDFVAPMGVGFWQNWAPPTIQDVRAIRTIPETVVPGIGSIWMDLNPTTANFTLNFPGPPSVSIFVPVPPGAGGPPIQLNMQALPFQPATNQTRPTTNLQTFFWIP